MGNYNPRIPLILGQEWCPIRDEDMSFSSSIDTVEVGYTYVQQASQRIRDARFYINGFDAPLNVSQTPMVNIYPAATAHLTGPIREAIIPVSFASITGTNMSFNSSTLAQAVYEPGDGYRLFVQNSGVGINRSGYWFDVDKFPLLANKRILNVSLLYSGYLTDFNTGANSNLAVPFVNPNPTLFTTIVEQFIDGGNKIQFTGPDLISNTGALVAFPTIPDPTVNNPSPYQTIGALNLGDINNIWDPTNPFRQDKMPWRYVDLLAYQETYLLGNRGHVRINFQVPLTFDSSPSAYANLEYVALRVLYCEETRVAYGARNMNGSLEYNFGANVIPIRNLLFDTDPVIPAGEYLVTLSWVNPGDTGATRTLDAPIPHVNGLRELYAIPSHTGKQLSIPFPLAENLDQPFTSTNTHIIPQISLHTSGGVLLDVHVYGRQAKAQVWGSITATQEIRDVIGASASYPQVRFYARRFGSTTVPLLLDSANIPGSSVSITPAEFDALSEIVDGWKEVTLRFNTPPAMGTSILPTWRWSASGELAGNRWEILGASALALTGMFPNTSLTSKVPAISLLDAATYGQPVSGAQINLAWINQLGPYVTGTVDDNSADAMLIFSQDMPTVTGFTCVSGFQPISGIGQNCGINPCCIPDRFYYNQLDWTATSSGIVPISGFGKYEMQRMDTVETTWQTIMNATAITGHSFRDYEARVGITSSYRVRAVNVYNFTGPWSTTVTGFVPSPGCRIGCTGGHLLLFSSNERQTGTSNLAYSSVWEGQVEENFAFPEAGFVQLQAMYNKNFFTAFRPTERGGEQFDRTVLVQAAAISPETLADFTSLRDMAWDNTSYVCVRDEDGNRWYATVLVPTGRVVYRRRIYEAGVRIIEVTSTPAPGNAFA